MGISGERLRMRLRRATTVLALASVMFLSGCFLKKKKASVPPQATAPTVQPAPTTPPPQPTQPLPQPSTTPATTPEKPTATTTATKPKPKHKKPPVAKKEQPSTTAKATPPGSSKPPNKIVIQEGGTTPASPQLSAGGPRESISHDRQTTEQLIDSAEANLRSVNHSLSAGEQDMVAQIRSFIQQSRQATTDGDTVRAHNLALKAHLLSDELVGQ